MRLAFGILIFFHSLSGISQEVPESSFKTNSLEIYCPTYYFYDNMNFAISPPLVFGLSYSNYKREGKFGFHVSTDFYSRTIPTSDYTPVLGDVLSRDAFFVSFGLDKFILKKNKFILTAFGEVNFRGGNEIFYAGGSVYVWSQVPRDFIDFGASLGSKITYRFKFGLTLSLSLKESFYFYRKDSGVEGWSFDNGTPRNVLNLNYALGWNFGRK